jgi:3-oxoacyl-(acyl-carrier-protein) synthase
MDARVMITGLGVVSPIGLDGAAFWQACLEGRSGVRRRESPWIAELDSRIVAAVHGFDAARAHLEPRQERLLDRTTQFALGAAWDGLRDAGFELVPVPGIRGRRRVEGVDPDRLGTVIGSGIGGISTLEVSHATWRDSRSKHKVKRFSLPMLIPNAPAGQVAIRFGARGECKSLSTACAAGTMAVGDAWRSLMRDELDVVIAGGAEGAAADEDGFALLGFERLHTLSRRNDEPERASRPFDRERDGFVLGEGAAVLVLEREAHARARGARAYAAITGYSANCDALSMMQLDESGEMIERLIRSALASACCLPTEVDYISAHGTSTPLNDRTEAKALRRVFGRGCDGIAVTALKSMTGHCIAASGPMEIAAAARSIRESRLVPTINYDHPDPECDLDVVANRPRERRVRTCLKLSYGFGGHNACLVLAPA